MTKKIEVAVELLETSIRCYMGSKEYFSAIHLAGAAEEIFGKYVRKSGEKDILTNFAEAMHKIGLLDGDLLAVKENKKYFNNIKNSVKHMDSVNNENVTIDAEMEARDMIERALINFNKLKLNATSTIIEYYEFDRQNS